MTRWFVVRSASAPPQDVCVAGPGDRTSACREVKQAQLR